jgi:rod shape determining protein RodA
MRQNQSLTGSLDWPLFVAILLMMGMGLATVYSATYEEQGQGLFDFSQKHGKQVIWIAVSLFLGLLVFLIDSDIYRKFAIPIYIFCLSLLVVVLFMPAVHGARAWLGFGSLGIQPAEFAKIGTAILLARYLGAMNINVQNANTVLIANLIIVIPMGLILLQPDAGTFVVFTSFLFVLYREGISFDPWLLGILNGILPARIGGFKSTWIGSHFIPILFVVIFLSVITLLFANSVFTISWLPFEKIDGIYGLILFICAFCLVAYIIMRSIFAKRDRKRAALISISGAVLASGLCYGVYWGFDRLADHQKERIELLLGTYEPKNGTSAPIEDGADYNRNRAMAAVGSGRLFGKGYGDSSLSNTRTNHVPESETDFIFCPYAEEWGFVGSLILVILFVFVMLRIVVIAERQKSSFNRIYAYSVAMITFYHFAVNIGMNIGFAPVIGIPLPFFSYGGSSMMSFSIMLFILLKLDSQRKDVLS